MKKNFTFFKSLLVAAGLCVGSSAWADDITSLPANYALNTGTSVAPFDAGTIKTGTNVTALNVNNTTATAWFNTDGNRAPYTLATDEEVTVSFTAYLGWNNNGANQGVKLLNSDGYIIAEFVYNLGGTNLTAVNIGASSATGWTSAYNCQSRYSSAKNANGFTGGSSTSQAYQTTGGWNPVFTFKIRYDGYVTLNVYYPNRKDGSIDNTYSGNLPDGWAVDLQKIQVYSGTNNDDRTIAINNLSISSEIAERHTVAFTYEDTDGKSLSALKANSNVDVAEGTNIESLISSSLTASFYNGDESIRYDYSTFVVDGGASTVPANDITVKLKFTPKAKFTHTAQAVEKDNTSNVLKADLASGYAYAGESLTLRWSKYIYVNSQWYVTNTLNGTYTEAGTSKIEFSSSDIDYFFEAEDMVCSRQYGSNTNDNSYSNGGGIGVHSGGNLTSTSKVVAGIYTVAITGIVRNASQTVNFKISYSTDGLTWNETGKNVTYKTNESGATTGSVTDVIIPAESYIRITDATGSNVHDYTDYITLKKTADLPATVSKTITNVGWATYCSPYNLDFTNEIDNLKAAYIVTGANSDQPTDDELTLEEVEGTVPANTGLLLEGEGECVIPVVASGDADNVSGNVLVGVTAEEEKDAKSIWVLMNGDNGVGFYYNNNTFTVGANTAYIPATATNFAIPTTGTKARFFSIDGNNATAIKSVESEKAENGVMYNLAGQRVGKDYKGIVIVNGKKYRNN